MKKGLDISEGRNVKGTTGENLGLSSCRIHFNCQFLVSITEIIVSCASELVFSRHFRTNSHASHGSRGVVQKDLQSCISTNIILIVGQLIVIRDLAHSVEVTCGSKVNLSILGRFLAINYLSRIHEFTSVSSVNLGVLEEVGHL